MTLAKTQADNTTGDVTIHMHVHLHSKGIYSQTAVSHMSQHTYKENNTHTKPEILLQMIITVRELSLVNIFIS